MDIELTPPTAGGANGGAQVKDSSIAEFQADVIDMSMHTPVLVDFWAPWCGPCRQLGPAIEKVVASFGGKLKLVKINIDENQALAGQMGIKSIPAVFAFAGGQPIDGFMGALPESEIQAFAQKVLDSATTGQPAADDDITAQIDNALSAATQALTAGDMASAEQIFSSILQHVPDNSAALFGLTQVQIANGDFDAARETLANVREAEQKSPEYVSALAALQLAEEAQALGPIDELEKALSKDPDDHQARFDLAMARNAADDRDQASETLVDLMRRDREWNEDGARKKLLELFEAWGPTDPATIKGRRLLSSILFA